MGRIMTGENFFVTEYTYTGTTSGQVCLGTSVPSKEFTKNFGAGFFGGQGFILQRLTGPGDAFVRASGALIERTLAPGEVLRISSGSLVAFEPTVHFDIQRMQGVKNIMFAGEGLFVTTLTGPGRVFLQGMPFDRMVSEIASRVPGGGGMMFVPGFGGGGGGAASQGGEGGDVAGEGPATEEVEGGDESEPEEESMFGYDGADVESDDDYSSPNSFVTEEDHGDLGDAAEGVVDFLKKWF
ncbi:hypothetical protein DYB28_011666 [Aphanomyces astaci]|uniref:Uncharacterized protein n=1 Tax=Aphanomyces astaci TaxID=112090 RepID=A0A397DAW1_APHAT|nr:hypothetical protein DYB30_001846 [Aphanomyces astaci]RHZ21760.1 hypothetical protein DYB31_003813 [Aphanomyces astaci]RHZ39741.1 hypothetical protein DYB26_010710 [Aphanomyces astaci]RLO07376.1 hypothetical protein DYB28_011666 [Aphanomyces astaci]